jgi:hypothetical protein
MFRFAGLLFLVFLTLKLTGYITWSWLWVSAPLWGVAALWFICFLFFVGYVLTDSGKMFKAARRGRNK